MTKTKNMKKFHFNTGVKFGVNPYLDQTATAVPAIGGGLVMVIPFECEDVPEGATVHAACNHPDYLKNNPNFIKREIFNTKMVSKYAFFQLPNKSN